MKLAPFIASVIACAWLLVGANSSTPLEDTESLPEKTNTQNQIEAEMLPQVSDSTEFIEIKPCEASTTEN